LITTAKQIKDSDAEDEDDRKKNKKSSIKMTEKVQRSLENGPRPKPSSRLETYWGGILRSVYLICYL
jgi:hypothetical protein